MKYLYKNRLILNFCKNLHINRLIINFDPKFNNDKIKYKFL